MTTTKQRRGARPQRAAKPVIEGLRGQGTVNLAAGIPLRFQSDACAGSGPGALEFITAETANPARDIRIGDHVLVDWSRKPERGAIGAIRQKGGGVRFARVSGGAATAAGRLVNPGLLLEVRRPRARP